MFLVHLFPAIFTLSIATAEKIYFPAPKGPHYVGKTQHIVNHTTYDDPVAPNGSNHTGSYFLLSMFYPTAQAPEEMSNMKYLDSKLASRVEKSSQMPTGSLQKLWTHLQWDPPLLPESIAAPPKPAVLLSPGLQSPCVVYSLLAADLASQGYTVLCIDHPGETPYLKLPSGEGVPGLPLTGATNNTRVGAIYRYRVSDIQALLQHYPSIAAQLGCASSKTHTYVGVGHSLGGATINGAMAVEASILGGINLDGTFWGDYTQDLVRPFLIMGEGGYNRTVDPTWTEWEAEQTGWWQDLSVRTALHYDYMDVPMIAHLLGLPPSPHLLLGNVGAYRMRDIMRIFVSGFFRMVVGEKAPLLEAELPNQQWKEVLRLSSSETE